MKRMELIANHSVEKEIIKGLEAKIDDFYYTLISNVHGRGKKAYRMGTSTWPEENFIIISYLNENDTALAEELVKEVKLRFPDEGIKLFFSNEG